MSSLLKLRIQGIRAFDNYTFQDLEFQTPLTLISGPNGVGKTTVIECLKYVTTGDLPPNAKGGAFVHDPRMSSEHEVYAQVKLLYKNSGSQKMVVTRSMKLSISPRGVSQFKTLEGQLKVYGESGASGALSSRCADLNAQVPISLGVPPAILNYVIFCHQEDSLWPLSEPSIVKKRFDEIFEASKYTKAIESLKTIRKEYLSNIRVEKVQVDHLKSDRLRVVEKKHQLKSLESRVLELEEAMKQMQDQRIQKSNEMDEAIKHGQRIQRLEFAVADADRIMQRTLDEIEAIKPQMRELSLSSEEIELEISAQDSRESQLDSKIHALSTEKGKFNDQLESNMNSQAEISNKRGRIEKAQEIYLEKKGELSEITGTSDTPVRWLETKNSELEDLNEEIELMEIDHRCKEDEISKQVSGFEAERLQLRRTVADAKEAIKELVREISSLETEMAKRQSVNADLPAIKAGLNEKEAECQRHADLEHEFETSKAINNAKDLLNQKEVDAESARKQLASVIDLAGAQSRLTFLKDTFTETRSKQEEFMEKLKHEVDNIREFNFLQSAPTNVLERAVKFVEYINNRYKMMVDELPNAKSGESDFQEELEKCESKICELESEKSQLSASLDGLNIKEYESRVYELEDEVQSTSQEVEQFNFAKKYFQKAYESAKSDHKCVLCEHSKSDAENEQFMQKLIAKLASLELNPSLKLENLNQRLSNLRHKSSIVYRIRAIDPELTKLNREKDEVKRELQEAELYTKDIENKIEDYEFEKVNNKQMESLVPQVQRINEDLTDLERKINNEQQMSQSVNSEPLMTPQQAQQLVADAGEQVKQARAHLDAQISKFDELKTNHQQSYKLVQSLKLKISDLERDLLWTKQTEEQISKLQTQRAAKIEALSLSELKIPEIDAKLSDKNKKLRSQKNEFAQEEKVNAEKKRQLTMSISNVEQIFKEILKFEDHYGSNPLSALKLEHENLQNEYLSIQTEIGNCDREIKELEKQKLDFKSYKRNLSDNLRVRKLESQLLKAEQEKQVYVSEMQSIQLEMQDYERNLQNLQNSVAELNHSISKTSGESKILRDQTQQIRHELSTTYKDSAERYRNAIAQLESTESASEDLVTYVKALDQAIMQYHSIKMAEINALLDELWKGTYTGTDIDTIMIRSESDVNSASTRASYNYRVCMLKQDTELDMRGRCSAGQKVLTCILIRMALAECFGNSSGMLVLDEPTTNLDRENIDALANSLGDIIDTRRSQNNFQLIVITHDEHFLAQMNPGNYCGFYYKIQRDSRQLSTIQKLPIASLNQ